MEQPAESVAAPDMRFQVTRIDGCRLDQGRLLLERAVGPIVGDVLAQHPLEVRARDDQDPIQTRLSTRQPSRTGYPSTTLRAHGVPARGTPGALLTRSHLRELGLERRAVDAVFAECPVIQLPGYSRPLVRAEAFLAILDGSTYCDRCGERVRPGRAGTV